MYRKLAGMTGTAATEAEELAEIYKLEVLTIPTHRPMIREDLPDLVYRNTTGKFNAVIEDIIEKVDAGRPVLVGTVAIETSEQLSDMLRRRGIEHEVLNAKQHAREAAIVARAGQRAAVTIATNMAGRGTDIKLGEGVAGLGGLYVIGTNKHQSRRIDNQLRGRAGRQGDPGCSRFFISREDDLLVKHGIDNPELKHNPDSIQRLVEGMNLDIRQFLHKYEGITEGQRQTIQQLRQDILTGRAGSASEAERLVRLTTVDELWSDHLAAIAELREGVHWVSFGGRDPLHEYLTNVHGMFQELQERIEEEVQKRMAEGVTSGSDATQRGATWTYLTTDEPFGSGTQRMFRGLLRKMKSRRVWG
jgi:preprotein translocase subunit SecA